MPYHVNLPNCPGCEDKLKDCVSALREFAKQIRSVHVDAHICWGYRDKESQDKAFLEGKSDLKWPHSKHNIHPSEALDWFRLVGKKAEWSKPYLRAILEVAAKNTGLRWGGDWDGDGKSEPDEWDYGHVEIVRH